MALGEEARISGREVHFAFRMEKLSGALGQQRLLSDPARQRLSDLIETKDAGMHPLRGLEGEFRFYTF
jgi:class 3 adenylate cyclase